MQHLGNTIAARPTQQQKDMHHRTLSLASAMTILMASLKRRSETVYSSVVADAKDVHRNADNCAELVIPPGKPLFFVGAGQQ